MKNIMDAVEKMCFDYLPRVNILGWAADAGGPRYSIF
jgi:hypothetical protein